MKRTLSISLLLVAAFAGAAFAQRVDQDRDPFFGDGPRSAATATVPDNDAWGRDPFNKPFEGTAAVQEAHAPERKLTGIIFGKSARIAIIGGEMVKEGDMVGDRKLMTIRERSIVLMNSNGSTEEIFLQNFSVSKVGR